MFNIELLKMILFVLFVLINKVVKFIKYVLDLISKLFIKFGCVNYFDSFEYYEGVFGIEDESIDVG